MLPANYTFRLGKPYVIQCLYLSFFQAKDIRSRSFRKKSNKAATPTLMHESAKLNIGEKKTKSSPPTIGIQSGK